MLYYKYVIDDQTSGFTESPSALNIKNFVEISQEEYSQLGGIVHEPVSSEKFGDLISALLD